MCWNIQLKLGKSKVMENLATQTKILRMVLTASLLLCGTGVRAEDQQKAPISVDDWTITTAPYLWASGLKGSTGLFGLPPQPIDLSFGDVVQDLKFGFMGVLDARKGPWSVGIDLTYASLQSSVGLPVGVGATTIDAKVKSFMGTAVVGYSIAQSATSNVDVIGGARVWSVDNEFDFNGGLLGGTSVSDGDTWVDPVLGVKFKADINPNVYFAGWAIVGGFGVASDSMWDLMGGVGYRLSETKSMFVGYRAADVDYSNNSGFVYNMRQQGPIIGATFRF